MQISNLGLGLTMQRWIGAGGGVAPATPIPVSPASSYTFAGDTDAFELTAPLPLGQYVMGEPFFVSDAATAFSKTGAPSVVVSSYMANGLEENFSLKANPTQGLDAMLGASVKSGVAALLTYAAGRNKDVTAAAANYPVSIGDEKTLVKASRTSGATTDFWGMLDKYRALTIVPTAKRPNVGDFRPAMSSLDKTSWVNVSDINLGGCLSLDISGISGGVGGVPTYATTLAAWRNPVAFIGIGADPLRVMQVLTHITATNYSADLAALGWWTVMHLHSAANSSAQKIELIKAFMNLAIEIEGQYSRGYTGGAGAGQHEFYGHMLGLAYLVTGKARFRTAFNAVKFNYDQMGWNLNPGEVTAWPDGNRGGLNQYVGPSRSEYAGQAFWQFQGVGSPTLRTTELDRTYLSASGRGRISLSMGLLAFPANGAIVSGPDLFTNGGAQSDTSVPRGSVLHYLDVERSTYPYEDADYMVAQAAGTYDLLRPLISIPKMTTFPPHPPLDFAVTAGAGAISWDISALVAANYGSVTNPITGVSIEVSQDGVQFVQRSTSAAASSTEVAGIPIWCRARTSNVNGAGAATRTWKKYSQDAAETNKVTPTGTASGTVTNVTAPALFSKQYPLNSAPVFIAATDGLDLGTPIFLGTGYWTGAISGNPTITVQTSATSGGTYAAAGGTIITDANGMRYYEPVLADSGLWLRVGVARNGSAVVYSSPVQLGVAASVPAAILIDTDFDYTGMVIYKAVVDSFIASSTGVSSVQKLPVFTSFVAGATEDDPTIQIANGVLRGVKNDQYPGLKGNLAARQAMIVGRTYQFTAKMSVQADGTAWNSDATWRLGTALNGENYQTAVLINYLDAPKQVTVTKTFVATGTTLFVTIGNSTNSSGTGGGNPILDYVKLEQLD